MKKRGLLSAVLAVVMTISMLTCFVLPAAAATSGTTGDCRWTLEDGILTISGTGAMANYSFASSIPWYGATIAKVIIKDGVTNIGKMAFYYSSGIYSITIPDSVVSIGNSAFYECSNLYSVTIPDSVTAIGNSAFYGCTRLNSVVLGDGIVTIGHEAFYNCIGLTSIIMKDGLTEIGREAFSDCTGLTSVMIPDSVSSIGVSAFYNTGVYNDSGNWEDDVLYIGSHLVAAKTTLSGAYTVKEGTLTIAGKTFYNCTELTSVTFPAGVTVIGAMTFYNCSKLTSVTIPAGVTAIGSQAFYNCSALASIDLPEEVTSIGQYAFYKCTALSFVVIPDGVATIGSYAFYGCSGLTSLTLSDSITAIEDYTFSGCSGLNSVVIPEGVTSIGEYAFSSCSGLISVSIPDTVVSLGGYAFWYCTGLTSVIIPESVTTMRIYVFTGCSNLKVAYVLNSRVSTSKNFPSTTEIRREFPKPLISVDAANGNLAVLDVNAMTIQSLSWGYAGAEAVEASTWEEFAAAVSLNERITDSTPSDGETYEMTKVGYYLFWLEYTDEYGNASTTCSTVYLDRYIDCSKPYLTIDSENTNLAILNTANLTVTRVYWGYAGTEAIETQNWNTFASAVPSAIRVNDYNPTEGEVYAMEKSGYYLFWIQYTDSEGVTQNICHTVYAEGALDENYGKPYLEFDESGKVAWMNLNGTTVQKMYWGFIGDTDYKYINWDEFCTRVRGNGSYLPDYGVKDGEGYVVNEEGYYRFVIVYLDAQGIRQERYFTIKAETPATAPSMDNSTLSNVATFINEEGYTAKTYYGYIGEENTKYVDFNDFKATATDFTTDFGTPAGKAFKLTKGGYWRFVINYNVNGATKDAIYTVYVDEADLALGTPKLTQSGKSVTLDANGATVSKVYVGYMGTDAVEIDSWADYIDSRQSNATYYGPKDGTAFNLGNKSGYYTVVVSYNTGGTDQLAFYTFAI